jgi:hypothetical protein
LAVYFMRIETAHTLATQIVFAPLIACVIVVLA